MKQHETETDAMRSLRELALSRYSCRAFSPEPVPRSVLENILEIAQRSASWSNCQPWGVTVVGGDARHRLSEALLEMASSRVEIQPDIPFPSGFNEMHMSRRREAGFRLYDAVGVSRGDKAAYSRQMLENFRFFGAPQVVIVTSPKELGPYGLVDSGAYVGLFLLAAHSMGVAAIAQAAPAGYSPVVREHLQIPDDRDVVCGISIGYSDETHPANSFRTSRAGLDEVVEWLE